MILKNNRDVLNMSFCVKVTLAVIVFVVYYFRLCLFIRNVLSDCSYAFTHKMQNLPNFGIVMLTV